MIKKILIVISICFTFFLFLGGCSDGLSDEERLARSAMQKTFKILENRYQMKSTGWSEGGDKKYYNNIGLNFRIYHVLSKDEGRKILIDAVNELLKEVNTTADLLPFLHPSPFTPKNVEISIIAFQPDGKDVYYPNISVFSYYNGKLHYKTITPETKFGYYTKEEETYEEALKIVRSQDAENT